MRFISLSKPMIVPRAGGNREEEEGGVWVRKGSSERERFWCSRTARRSGGEDGRGKGSLESQRACSRGKRMSYGVCDLDK